MKEYAPTVKFFHLMLRALYCPSAIFLLKWRRMIGLLNESPFRHCCYWVLPMCLEKSLATTCSM